MWERAKKIAGKDGLSSVISEAIRQYVLRKERELNGVKHWRFEVGWGESGPKMAALDSIDMEQPTLREGTTGRIEFEGRMLVQGSLPVPMNDLTQGQEEEVDVNFATFRTLGGKLILLAGVRDNIALHYAVYTTMNQLKEDPQLLCVEPADRAPFLDALAKEVGEDWAIRIE